LFLFFYVTEGEKQGSGVDSVCGVIKREMSIFFFFVSVFFNVTEGEKTGKRRRVMVPKVNEPKLALEH
jgi:hypothetical protein